MIRWLVPAILSLLAVLALTLSIRAGLFRGVEISEHEWPAMKVVAKTHVGPYHEMLPTLEEVEKWVREQGVDCDRSFGEFLDDPNVVEHERLRSRVGCVLPDGAGDFPSPLPKDFEMVSYPSRRVVVGDFAGSPALGPYKVYGKAQGYIRDKGYKPAAPPLEIYETGSGLEFRTQYLFPFEEGAKR